MPRRWNIDDGGGSAGAITLEEEVTQAQFT
jgi:hypothetical protein